MATEMAGKATQNGPTQADDSKEKLLADLSTEELSNLSCHISERLGRSFSGRTKYENKKELNVAADEAQKAFPNAVDAYKPSGKTTALAILLMVLATPVVLALMTGICGGLCWGWSALATKATFLSNDTRLMGVCSAFLDLVLVILMITIPLKCYELLSKWCMNRNPFFPATLAGGVDLALAIILFVPIWHGETLAPTHLTFVFIPIRWVLIVIGGVLVPFTGAIMVHGTVSGQKFCEQTGVYLKKIRRANISFDYAENVLALLKRGEFLRAVSLQKATIEQIKSKHFVEISLWWHEKAKTAFLEMEIRFHGELSGQKASKRESKDKNWRAFSVPITVIQAEVLARELESSITR